MKAVPWQPRSEPAGRRDSVWRPGPWLSPENASEFTARTATPAPGRSPKSAAVENSATPMACVGEDFDSHRESPLAPSTIGRCQRRGERQPRKAGQARSERSMIGRQQLHAWLRWPGRRRRSQRHHELTWKTDTAHQKLAGPAMPPTPNTPSTTSVPPWFLHPMDTVTGKIWKKYGCHLGISPRPTSPANLPDQRRQRRAVEPHERLSTPGTVKK